MILRFAAFFVSCYVWLCVYIFFRRLCLIRHLPLLFLVGYVFSGEVLETIVIELVKAYGSMFYVNSLITNIFLG